MDVVFTVAAVAIVSALAWLGVSWGRKRGSRSTVTSAIGSSMKVYNDLYVPDSEHESAIHRSTQPSNQSEPR